MPAVTKTQRWLDLIAFLAGRRVPVAFEEIMEGVPPYAADWRDADRPAQASVRRKFERDKDELRTLGIPIETVHYAINYGLDSTQGYRLSSDDFYLPYVRLIAEAGEGGAPAGARPPSFELREGEARAAIEALHRVAELPSSPLRREARSALRKLTFDLAPDLAAAVRETPVRYLAPPGSGDLRERLRVLSDALLRRKEVRFRYHGMRRDAVSDRRVYPFGLLFQHSHWYLIGHDLDRDALRVFRLGRMEAPEVNATSAKSRDYEVPDDFTLSAYAGRPPWALPGQDDEPLDVTVRFAFPRSLWAERNRHGEPLGQADDGAQLRRFQVQDAGPFLGWMLTLGGEARIESPPEMQSALRALADRIASQHRAPVGERGAGDGSAPGDPEETDG
jgi:proteasome accessory factor B